MLEGILTKKILDGMTVRMDGFFFFVWHFLLLCFFVWALKEKEPDKNPQNMKSFQQEWVIVV